MGKKIRWLRNAKGQLMSQGQRFLINPAKQLHDGLGERVHLMDKRPAAETAVFFVCLDQVSAMELAGDLAQGKGVLAPPC